MRGAAYEEITVVQAEAEAIAATATRLQPPPKKEAEPEARATLLPRGGGSGASWRTRLGPMMMQLRVANAMRQAGSERTRAHAVDEADEGHDVADDVLPHARMLGSAPTSGAAVAAAKSAAKVRWEKVRLLLLLKLRVTGAFRAVVADAAAAALTAKGQQAVDDGPRAGEALSQTAERAATLESSRADPAKATHRARSYLVGWLAVTIGKWQLDCRLRPVDLPTRTTLADELHRALATLEAQPRVTWMVGESFDLSELLRASEELLERLTADSKAWASSIEQMALAAWPETRASALLDADGSAGSSPSDSGIGKESVALAATCVDEVIRAKGEVVDVNAELLSRHMEKLWSKLVGEAAEEVIASGLSRRTVLKFKCQSIHRTMVGGMNDVASQFAEGMLRQLRISTRLSDLERSQLSDLCAAAIDAFRAGFDRPWQMAALEEELEARCPVPEQLTAALTQSDGATTCAHATSAVQDGVSMSHRHEAEAADLQAEGALLDLVLGKARLPLDHAAVELVASAVAAYLDPFIDGHVAVEARKAACGSGCLAQVQATWAQMSHTGHALPALPADCVLAQYLVHAITKMNTNFGFSEHLPGVGRTPVSDYEAMQHIMLLGSKLREAIERDFPAEQFEPASRLRFTTAEQLTNVASQHLDSLHRYIQQLNAALSKANEQGQLAQKQERIRLFNSPR